MLYTIFVFTLGVYVGQEYPNVPSVKTTFNKTMEYLNNTPTQNIEENKYRSILDTITHSNFLKYFEKENKET
jgi:hypothetical protein